MKKPKVIVSQRRWEAMRDNEGGQQKIDARLRELLDIGEQGSIIHGVEVLKEKWGQSLKNIEMLADNANELLKYRDDAEAYRSIQARGMVTMTCEEHERLMALDRS